MASILGNLYYLFQVLFKYFKKHLIKLFLMLEFWWRKFKICQYPFSQSPFGHVRTNRTL